LIDEIVREGARRMLAAALEAEVDVYVSQFVDERDENGRRLVVTETIVHLPHKTLQHTAAPPTLTGLLPFTQRGAAPHTFLPTRLAEVGGLGHRDPAAQRPGGVSEGSAVA
jgi:hypothetical protein